MRQEKWNIDLDLHEVSMASGLIFRSSVRCSASYCLRSRLYRVLVDRKYLPQVATSIWACPTGAQRRTDYYHDLNGLAMPLTVARQT